MSLVPIFDTNIFGHVQSGEISQKDWRFLLSPRPRGGWPLSSVTAIELIAPIGDVPTKKFAKFRNEVKLAHALSQGRVHEEPRFLICRDLLNVPFPATLAYLSAGSLADHIGVIRRARNLLMLHKGVRYKGGQEGCETHPPRKASLPE